MASRPENMSPRLNREKSMSVKKRYAAWKKSVWRSKSAEVADFSAVLRRVLLVVVQRAGEADLLVGVEVVVPETWEAWGGCVSLCEPANASWRSFTSRPTHARDAREGRRIHSWSAWSGPDNFRGVDYAARQPLVCCPRCPQGAAAYTGRRSWGRAGALCAPLPPPPRQRRCSRTAPHSRPACR